MADISTVWVPLEARGDWQLAGADLLSGNDLDTAVYISLFSDQLASADDIIPDGTTDRRGWWGDEGETVPIGSKLWLLSRSTLTTAVALLAQNYITEALQWLIDDGVAASVSVTTQIQTPSMLGAVIQIFKTGSTQPVTLKYSWAWAGIN
jgi:phage gp46-like protein